MKRAAAVIIRFRQINFVVVAGGLDSFCVSRNNNAFTVSSHVYYPQLRRDNLFHIAQSNIFLLDMRQQRHGGNISHVAITNICGSSRR
jgi:hypothetical protein